MPRRSRAELATPHLVDDDYSIEAPPAPAPPHLSPATQAWWGAFGADQYACPQGEQRHIGVGRELFEPTEFPVGELGRVGFAAGLFLR